MILAFIYIIKVCRLRRKTFLFFSRSADYVGRPFCFCVCVFLIIIFIIIKVCRLRRKSFLFCCVFYYQGLPTMSGPFCFCCVSYYFLLLLMFPTLVGNLSVVVLSFLIILYFSSSLFSPLFSIHNFNDCQPIDFSI